MKRIKFIKNQLKAGRMIGRCKTCKELKKEHGVLMVCWEHHEKFMELTGAVIV